MKNLASRLVLPALLAVAVPALTTGALGIAKIRPSDDPIRCPIGNQKVDEKGNPIEKAGFPMEFKGIRFATCCEHCGKLFIKHPDKTLGQEPDGVTVGMAFFDPVDRLRIAPKQAVGFSDYKHVRFFFRTKEHKASFDSKPSSFGELPTSEELVWTANEDPMKWAQDAAGFVDYQSVRYYAKSLADLKAIKGNPAVLSQKGATLLFGEISGARARQ